MAFPTYVKGKYLALTHACGTLRSGVDPETSVVDANCKAHDVENLYVASSFRLPVR